MTNWNDATRYLRIVALAWFAYDWALTLPAEIRLYRKQGSWARPSPACILLFLARYLGLAALLVNLFGFFADSFPSDKVSRACEHFYLFIPITQCLATWASHAVFVVRTWAICHSTGRAKWAFVAAAVAAAALELYSQLHSFVGLFHAGSSGNCLIQFSEKRNVAWLFYAVSTFFDLIIVVATYIGLQLNYTAAAKSGNRSSSSAPNFRQMLWDSSMVYFIVTTFWNICNLIYYAIYINSNATVFTAIGIAMTSMMSVRVILDAHDFSHRRASTLPVTSGAFGQSVPTTGHVSNSSWVKEAAW